MSDGIYTSNARSSESDALRIIDESLERLRWCRQHYQEHGTSQTMREIEATLGYLAQALIWQDEGDKDRAAQAMGLAQGRSLREQNAIRQMWEEMWWSH
jgi:hypothetical protein